jgi:hypothetical protein
MTQPQNPWGDQQSGQPQQPTQQYQFPQAGYGQPQPPQQQGYPQQQPPPVYYQQPQAPQQWNPSGVYGGSPVVKKSGMPAWGWVLVALAVLVLIGAGANANKATTSNTTQQAAVTASLDNSSQVNATSTAYAAKYNANMTAGAASQQVTSAPLAQTTKAANAVAPTQAPVNTPVPAAPAQSTSNKVGVKVAGPGQELIGQGGVDSDLKITVTSVERYSQVFDSKGKPIPSQGVFLLVLYDKENIGTEPHGFTTLSLVDGNGRKFSSSSNMDASFAFAFNGNYQDDLSIQPSFKGKGYTVFEVPADASNFKLKLGF